MSRWSEFRTMDERLPETWFEADVFLSNAGAHIRNREFDYDALREVMDARDRLYTARNGGSILAKIEVAA